MARMAATVRVSLLLCLAAAAFAVSARAGSLNNIYVFTGGADGGQLYGGVVQDAAGTLYGETENGGDLKCTIKGVGPYGCGTVFSYSATKGLTVLATFTGPNGKFGNATPALVGSTLYGSTQYGGATNQGLIFSVNTNGSNAKILHQFHGTDGVGPVQGPMIKGPGNALYGITSHGGAYGKGMLFALKATGAYQVLHSFTGGADGWDPLSLLLAPGGTLVGSTAIGGVVTANCSNGAGVVFTYTPSSKTFSVGADLTCGETGPSAYLGSLGSNNLAYGVNDANVFFSVNVGTGAVSVIPAVSGNAYGAGGSPESGPILMPDGSLIGTFSQGPVYFGGIIAFGDLYQVSNGEVNDLVAFEPNATGGLYPYAQPLLTASGTLLGTSAMSNCTNCGVIWQYTP
jgi:uncharacterized repeat protein (TIGR03803 family)